MTLFYVAGFFFIHMCIHFGPFLPLPSKHSLTPTSQTPRFQAEPVLPFSLILLKNKHKH
jgi:hypothetical protein